MTTNQEGVHLAVRDVTGTTRSYNEDWHALFDADGITAGTFNERMLAWINSILSSSYTNLNEAMQAFAVDQGFANWASMNTFVLFNETSVANLQAWFAADRLGATYADGATVSSWPDLSGNSRAATAAGTPLFRTAVLNGKPGIEFITTTVRMTTPSFLDATYNTGISVYGVVKRVGTTTAIFSGSNNTQFYLGNVATNTPTANTTPLSDTQITTTEPTTAYLHSFRYDGAAKTLEVYGTDRQYSNSEAATGNLNLSGALGVGNSPTANFAWNGQLLELLVYKGALNAGDHAIVCNYLRGKYALNFASNPQVFCDGNSLTFGTGATVSYPTAMANLLPGWDITNYGVPSAQTSARATAAPAIKIRYGSNRSRNVAVLWECTNDLYYNQDPTNAISRYAAWCADVRSAGYKVIAATVLPRTEASVYANFEADRQTVNTSIRANWTTYADALADLAADTRIGDPGDSDNTTYYGDKVHLTNAGYAIVAQIVSDAIATL